MMRRSSPPPLPLLAAVLLAIPGCSSPEGRGENAGSGERGARSARPEAVQTADAFDELVAAERAFAASSVEHGMRHAFLAHFAPDVVTFAPHPVVGTAELEAGPPGPHLEWWPSVGEVSAAGDMGYTTGPYRAPGPDGRDRWGHYHSVWARKPDGGWHVLLDVGGPHGPVPLPDSVTQPSIPTSAASRGDPSDLADDLLAADRAFATAAEHDPDAALRHHALPRARFYRLGSPPLQGVGAAVAHRTARDERLTWDPIDGGVSASGDLGYSWGTGTVTTGDEPGARPMSYARVWRRAGRNWRVVLEVVLPHPPHESPIDGGHP